MSRRDSDATQRPDRVGRGLSMEPLSERDATKPTKKSAPKSTKKSPSPKAAKPAAAVKAASPAKTPKSPKPDGKLSQLDAAVKVLTEAGTPMTTKAMIEAMAAKGYWTSPGGATPHATLYSAILRQLQKKGADARFVKADRGQFTLNPATKAT